MAHLLDEHTITVLIDLWKCYELVDPAKLMQQAVIMGFPLRLAWMSVQLYFSHVQYRPSDHSRVPLHQRKGSLRAAARPRRC